MYLMHKEPERQRECLKRVTENMKYFLAGFLEKQSPLFWRDYPILLTE